MEDYPKTLMEFETRFSSEVLCRQYLAQFRWADGFRCPRCNGSKCWPASETFFQCASCNHQTSVTAGTIFQDTHLPLMLWFRAMWWVTSQKDGASALGLKRVLGCSYKTAWMLLHKFRRAMVRPGRDRLKGIIEVDETYLGGLEEGLRGRQIENKALIAIATQIEGKNIGRIRLKRVPNASADSLQGFIQETIDPGSIIYTDGWTGYANLESKGYRHKVIVLSNNKRVASDLLPHVHRIASLLKRWLMGTHQGAISHEHLDYYLDEYVFRFNRRTSQYRGKLFYRMIQQAVQTGPVTFAGIRQNVRGLGHGKHHR